MLRLLLSQRWSVVIRRAASVNLELPLLVRWILAPSCLLPDERRILFRLHATLSLSKHIEVSADGFAACKYFEDGFVEVANRLRGAGQVRQIPLLIQVSELGGERLGSSLKRSACELRPLGRQTWAQEARCDLEHRALS